MDDAVSEFYKMQDDALSLIADPIDTVNDKFKMLHETIKDTFSTEQLEKFYEVWGDEVANAGDTKPSDPLEENKTSLDDYMMAFGDLTNVVSKYGQESSKAMELAQAAEKAMAVTQAIRAVIRAWGDPFPLNLVTVPTTIAATGALLASIGAGGGGGGASAPSMQEVNKFNIEAQYNPALDKMDRQIELLEAIERNGSASRIAVDVAGMTFERDYALFVNEAVGELHDRLSQYWGPRDDRQATESALNEYLGFDIGTNIGEANNSGDTEAYVINKNALRDSYNFMRLIQAANTDLIRGTDWEVLFDKGWVGETDTPFNMMIARIGDFTNEFQELLSEYTLSLLDSMDELKSAKDDFMGFYDDITGSLKYENQKIANAFDEVEKLTKGMPLSSYLESEIDNIIALEKYLTEDKINILLQQDPTKLEEQLKILEDLEEQTGLTFENGAEDALNYLESIELVSEAMATSRENIQSFISGLRSDARNLELSAYAVGVNTATSYDDIYKQFELLSSDTLGLTDDELEYLESAIDAVKQSAQDALDAQIKVLEDNNEAQIKALQDEQKSLNEILNEITSNIRTLENLTKSIDDTIYKLRNNDVFGQSSLQNFYDALNEAKGLIGTDDYSALSDAVQKAIGLTSELYDTSNFAGANEMRYTQLLSANEFEDMNIEMLDQLDYLELIEENTRATADALSAEITNLSDSLSSNIQDLNDNLSQDSGLEDLIASLEANGLVQAITPEEAMTLDKATADVMASFQSVLGWTPDTSSDGFQYWLNELLNNPNITSGIGGNIDFSIASGAYNTEWQDEAEAWAKNIGLYDNLIASYNIPTVSTSTTPTSTTTETSSVTPTTSTVTDMINRAIAGGYGESLINSYLSDGVISEDLAKSLFLQYGTDGSLNGLSNSLTYSTLRSVAMANGAYTPFADGGIVTAPTVGLIGEAGYNEAVIPLKDPNDPLQMNEVSKELSDIKKLLIRLAADNNSMLNIERALLQQ